MTLPSLTIVIPTKDERGNVEPAVLRMPDFSVPTEILFADGHSADGSLVSRQLGLRLVPQGEMLRLLDLASGQPVLTRAERAEQEHQRAEQEHQRAEQEHQRAEQERQRAEQEQQRAEQERQRAEEALRREAQLQAELQRLHAERQGRKANGR